MPLSIKSEVAEQLARKIASETGESITEAIRRALEERWKRLNQPGRRSLVQQIDDIMRRVDALPGLDHRTADEILGYDEHGLPR
jgi:antitoxin VapB